MKTTTSSAIALVLGLLLVILFMYLHPGIFPMSGFNGPDTYTPAPSHVRLSGDSWRYLSGGESLMHHQPLDTLQRSYSGYCLLNGIFGRHILLIQALAAILALLAVMSLGQRLEGMHVAILGGALFALNPEFAAWHCAIMTESLYTSAVCINAWLACKALERQRLIRMPLVFLFIFLTAFIRPSGWIQLPAVLIYWTCHCIKPWRWKLIAVLLIVIGFFLVAITFATTGINNQSPAAKLYAGEVVWQEDLWRVNMPPANMSKTGIIDGLLYGLRHPLMSSWLVCKRLGVMFLRIRPSYSKTHNLFLMAYHLPIALLGILGIAITRRKREGQIIATMLAAHALIVALTFNDNDGRFSLYFTPLLATAAVAACAFILRACWKRFRHTTPETPSPDVQG